MKSRDLFNPTITKQPYKGYTDLRDSDAHADARRLMNDTFNAMGDPDGNFIRDFQSHNFHSRVFELASYAYLTEQGFSVDRPEHPDYVVSRGALRIGLEAVTSNPPHQGSDISLRALQPVASFEEARRKSDDEYPIRVGRALGGKLEKKTKAGKHYWELPECVGHPFVLMVAPFHEAGSLMYLDEHLARFLYGLNRSVGPDGSIVQTPIIEHVFNDVSLPSNFFGDDLAESISAVLWCNQFSVPRFLRAAAERSGSAPGVSLTVEGYCAMDDTEVVRAYEYVVGSRAAPAEPWWRGVTVFHNPRAFHPLADGDLRCTSSFRVENGKLLRRVHGFHPLTSFTAITPRNGEALALVPNSQEWLAAMEKRDPRKALASRMAVKMSGGRIDVCTICGDDPAAIFRDDTAPADEPLALIRLCDDCSRIQSSMGSRFTREPDNAR